MSNFSVDPLKENSIMYLYAIRDEIDFNPIYQRQSDVWPLSKRTLLIDSLLNGFDIPKIYFHEINKKRGDQIIKYSVIDGKQRLESIFSFLDGKFSVPDDFQDMAGVFSQFTGKMYQDFGKINLKLKARFESLPLPVYIVKTNDTELIEEMFSRLNEASPLNAPEKRNAFSGPVPRIIQSIAGNDFFTKKVPFKNKRYRHYDVIAKLLLLTEKAKVVDTKKIHLDKFVKDYIGKDASQLSGIETTCVSTLGVMSTVFRDNDQLLRLVTMMPIYYSVFLVLINRNEVQNISVERLENFETIRKENRLLAQDDEENPNINFDYLEYDRLTQTPNDSSSIEFKINTLLEFLGCRPLASKLLE